MRTAFVPLLASVLLFWAFPLAAVEYPLWFVTVARPDGWERRDMPFGDTLHEVTGVPSWQCTFQGSTGWGMGVGSLKCLSASGARVEITTACSPSGRPAPTDAQSVIHLYAPDALSPHTVTIACGYAP